MDYALIVTITILTAASTVLILTALLYRPDKAAIRKKVKGMYREADKEGFFASLMRENQQKGDKGAAQKFKVSDKFAKEFESSGIDMSPNEFVMIWIAATLIPTFICLTMSSNAIMTVGVMVVGFALPLIYFKKKQNDRREAFNKQFADVLLTMVNGLHAGFSFQQTMVTVAKDSQPPVSEEFGKALAEIEYGVSLHDALYHIYERIGCEDMKMLIASLDISQRVGGNLSDVLETISETVRMRIKVRQEVKTLSAQGKMSALIIGLLPVVLIVLLSIVNPDYIGQLLYTHTGQIMLVVAAIMEAIGFFLMNKITDVRL